jgi:hypothetical protein
MTANKTQWTARALALAGCLGCTSGIAQLPPADAPRTVPFARVPTPPPAAVPETLSPRPLLEADVRWLDGAWHYGINRWVWYRGGWIALPKGATYFPGDVTYDDDGSIGYRAPVWVDDAGRVMDAPPIVAPALTPLAPRSVERLVR